MRVFTGILLGVTLGACVGQNPGSGNSADVTSPVPVPSTGPTTVAPPAARAVHFVAGASREGTSGWTSALHQAVYAAIRDGTPLPAELMYPVYFCFTEDSGRPDEMIEKEIGRTGVYVTGTFNYSWGGTLRLVSRSSGHGTDSLGPHFSGAGAGGVRIDDNRYFYLSGNLDLPCRE